MTAEERQERKSQVELAELKSSLLDKMREVDFLKHALLKVKESQRTVKSGAPASTTSSSRGSKSKAS
jgi:hypothetical protein